MSGRTEAWQEVIDCCRSIDLASFSQVFSQLWDQGRLSYSGDSVTVGGIDEISAHLAVSALGRRQHLLLALPDDNPRRSALIFGSALLATAVESAINRTPAVNVALFGSSIAIRSYLALTKVRQVSLASVFPQVHFQSDNGFVQGIRDQDVLQALHLPKVIGSLSPSSPTKLLDRYRPRWIAVECDNARDAKWLPDVARWAIQHQVPLIGWICADRPILAAAGRTARLTLFQWPLLRGRLTDSGRDESISGQAIVETQRSLSLTPLQIDGGEVGPIADCLAKANVALAKCHAFRKSGPAEDGLRIAWRYLRTIETLPVPVSFYEQECRAFWGLRPLSELRAVAGRFIDAITSSDPEVAKLIEEAVSAIDDASERMGGSGGVLLWEAARELAVGRSDVSTATQIVFPTASRRRLFELALLGLDGITQKDLTDLHVTLVDLGHNSTFVHDANGRQKLGARVIVPGLVTTVQLAELHLKAPTPDVGIAIYPHQLRMLEGRVATYSKETTIDVMEQDRALRICGSHEALDRDMVLSVPIEVCPAEQLLIRRPEANQGSEQKLLWTSLFATVGAADLLDPVDEEPANEDLVEHADADDTSTEEGLTVERAIEVQITGSRVGLFSADFRINLIRVVAGRETIVERTVRSVATGDRLVLVHGQRRQSLYELLIGRVHRHPSIQLHLSLIKVWQDEIATAFPAWVRGGKSVGLLLLQLRARGSRIQSELAIRFWSEGKVLAPLDPEDLVRVATVLSMPFTREHHERIARAADRLRGLHRGLALRLSYWLRKEAAGLPHDGDDEVIDAELGLTLRDFKDSLEIVTVTRVAEHQGLFLRTSLNTFKTS